uniref:DNA topoisomerase n=1 Tax=Panagrellus redivivus TaxID=6233 RepID=A0A7E4VYT0_PANRE
MVNVLMVAEKPILAESIAKLLSNHKQNSRKGFNGACSVHEFNDQFMGKPAHYKVTSTCGHVMGLDFPGKYNNWDRVDPGDLFQCPTEKKEANPKLKMVKYLASEATNCDYLVLWLDCDKEGENICFEVIDAVQGSMKRSPSGRFMDVVFRAHFSAIAEKEIKAAMRNLVKPNLNESLSVDARQELDLRVGCAFTRFQTRYFQDKYGDLDSNCISFGPCQTPTLAFCVKRHDQIVQFSPETYFVLSTTIDSPNGRTVKLDWSRERIFDRDIANVFLNRVKAESSVKLSSATSKENKKEKPQALNTVELLRIASSSMGLGPAQTMSVAEHLYTHGYISYPRTETTAYPSSFDFNGTLKTQLGGRFNDIAQQILADGITKPKAGEDKGDHPPITPMKPNNGYLSGDQARVYDYVTQHFLATIMKPCKYITSTFTFTAATETFTLQSRKVVDPGFTKAMSWQAIVEDESYNGFKEGSTYAIQKNELLERQTSPPDYLTESELITLMEKYGIGTDASIPVHISNISARNYVTVESGRRLIPTKLGVALVRGYRRIDPELILPTMRSDMETQLNLIAKGQAEYTAVTGHTLEMFRRKFKYFVEHIAQIDVLFEDSFTPLADSGKPFSRCGKCKRYMKLVASRPQRLYCPTCQETLSLPTGRDGNIRIHGEKTCPLDGFDLLYWAASGGKLADSWSFCPYCYNNAPFEDMKSGVGCNRCTHPTCKHGMMTQSICQCLNACNNGAGVLVLDPQSGPKWRLACNLCPSVITVFDGAARFKLLDKECNDCGTKTVFAEYTKKSKLPNEEPTFTGCIFCRKDELGALINFDHAQMREDIGRIQSTRGFRGRGRGRGRGGGRGRGRGGHDR